MKKPAPKGHTAKHAPAGSGRKHSGHSAAGGHKHSPPAHTKAVSPPAVMSHPSHPRHQPGGKVRKLALGSAVSCCSAEALAASLRMTGWPVQDADVLALYWRTAADPDAGASILATLEAAEQFGLAGARLADSRPAELLTAATVCGVTLRGGPHAYTLASQPGLAWSWGSLYRLPAADVEEAWEVRWL